MSYRDQARNIAGRGQVFVNAYAKALEVIPRQLCDNAGYDATDVLSRLRNKHSQTDGKGRHFGVDIETGACIFIGCAAHNNCTPPAGMHVPVEVSRFCVLRPVSQSSTPVGGTIFLCLKFGHLRI